MDRKEFPLFEAIEDDKGNKLSVVKARLICLSELLQVQKDHEEETDRGDALIMLSTGLTSSELERLSYPDYTSLGQYMDEQLRPASQWSGNESTKTVHCMLQPVEFSGEMITETKTRCPSVKAVRLRDKQKDSISGALFIISNCTGVDPEALKCFSLPDWTEVSARVATFLQQPASFFQSEMPN